MTIKVVELSLAVTNVNIYLPMEEAATLLV